MTAHHTPQREAERSAVGEVQSRREEEKKQARFIKVMVALGVLLGLITVPISMILPIAFLVQWLRWMLRHEVVPIGPTVLLLVGMMALIAALHFLQRESERYGLGGTISSVASFVGVALIAVGVLIGDVFQEWVLATNAMGVGLGAASIGLAGLAIVTLKARVLPWWGGAALIAGNPLLDIMILFGAPGWMWERWLVPPVPWLVVGFAVFLAGRRRTKRAARVR